MLQGKKGEEGGEEEYLQDGHGGAGGDPQLQQERRLGVDVLVATVGRAAALVEDGSLKLDACRTVVLDEVSGGGGWQFET
jgi:superfamily II DNA/RNA helicase